MQEQNEKVVNAIMKLIEKVQEERDEGTNTTSTGQKRKGACFICIDPDHYAPDCPNKKEKKPAGIYNQKGGPYYQKGNQAAFYFQKGNQGGFQQKQGNPTSAQRKQSTNCYHYGQPGHWAAECPNEDIPADDQF